MKLTYKISGLVVLL